MSRSHLATALSVTFLAILAPTAGAQDARQNAVGEFDFYVLALSWSPSFCEANAERGGGTADQQCGERPFSFVVHGLWPQYEKGFRNIVRCLPRGSTATSSAPCST